jgi:hypothetical protein
MCIEEDHHRYLFQSYLHHPAGSERSSDSNIHHFLFWTSARYSSIHNYAWSCDLGDDYCGTGCNFQYPAAGNIDYDHNYKYNGRADDFFIGLALDVRSSKATNAIATGPCINPR